MDISVFVTTIVEVGIFVLTGLFAYSKIINTIDKKIVKLETELSHIKHDVVENLKKDISKLESVNEKLAESISNLDRTLTRIEGVIENISKNK